MKLIEIYILYYIIKDMENFNPKEYRNEQAKKIKAVREIDTEIASDYLNKIKKTEEYEVARIDTREANYIDRETFAKEIESIHLLQAEATLREIRNPDLRLLAKNKLLLEKNLVSGDIDELIKIVRSSDLKESEIKNRLEGFLPRLIAIGYIKQAEDLVDREQLRTSLLTNYSINLKINNKDYEGAKELIMSSADSWSKIDYLLEIAEKEGKGDFEEAKELARYDNYSKEVILKIAEKEGNGDFEEAKEAYGGDNRSVREAEARFKVLSGDFEEAKEILGKHSDGEYDHDILLLIAQTQLKQGDIEGAKRNLELTTNFYGRDPMAVEIAEIQFQNGDIDGAKETLAHHRIFHYESQIRELSLLLKIIEKEGKGNFEEAKEFVRQENNDHRHSKFFSLIAEKEGKGDFEKAINSVKNSDDVLDIIKGQLNSGYAEEAAALIKNAKIWWSSQFVFVDQAIPGIVKDLIARDKLHEAKIIANTTKSGSFSNVNSQIEIGSAEDNFTNAKIAALKLEKEEWVAIELGEIALRQYKIDKRDY